MEEVKNYLEQVETFALMYFQTGDEKDFERVVNAKNAVIKRIEELELDIKALSQDVNRLSAESGKQYTKLYKIKEILNA